MSRQTVNDNATETKDCGLYANMLLWHSFTNLGATPRKINQDQRALPHTHWNDASDDTYPTAPPKTNQNLRTLTHTHTHIQTTPCPTGPPQTESKKSANPHPYTWSKNPYRSSYLGKKKTWQSLLSRLPTLKATSPSECPCSKNLQAQLMVDASQQNSLKGSVHPNLLHPKDNPYPRGGGTNHHLK